MAIDEKFAEHMKSGTGAVVIMAGSNSDGKHIDKIVGALNKYKLAYDVRISSAHKEPGRTHDTIFEYNNIVQDNFGSSYAIIVVAGMTDALSGLASIHAMAPVVSCPPEGTNKDLPKNTVNTSCLMNPPGSSNAYILRPDNAARFIAQMYAARNKQIQEILFSGTMKKISELQEFDREFQEKYAGEQK